MIIKTVSRLRVSNLSVTGVGKVVLGAKTKRGPRIFAPTKPRLWDGGVRLGTALRGARQAQERDESEMLKRASQRGLSDVHIGTVTGQVPRFWSAASCASNGYRDSPKTSQFGEYTGDNSSRGGTALLQGVVIDRLTLPSHGAMCLQTDPLVYSGFAQSLPSDEEVLNALSYVDVSVDPLNHKLTMKIN